jgi:hypothetical protein
VATLESTATVTSTTPEASSGDESGMADTTVGPVGDYFTVVPCRAADTRSGAPLQNGVAQTFALRGICGIPLNAASVVLNVTAVGATGSGDLTIYPSDATPPTFAIMPFQTTNRALIVFGSISSDAAGEVTVLPSVAGNGTVHLVIDVMGYFE